jgi:murein L,D-transpeptidase YafK
MQTLMAGIRAALHMAAFAILIAIAGCQGNTGVEDIFPKAEKPLPADIVKTMETKGMTAASPIMLRIFKQENVVEVWKATNTGRYDLLKEYEICKWSGKLGPKFAEGDRQAPEGFYTINPWQMNPNSDYYLAFNLGFPNAFDRAHGRTGTHLMVHGACSSAGCYSMTDERIAEIFALARDAFKGGQKSFQVQAYPFRMTAANMAEYQNDQHFDFWKMLKEGYDHFEITRAPPKVDVCDKRYVFNRIPDGDKGFKPQDACPQMTVPSTLALAYGKLITKEDEVFQKALKSKAVKEAWSGKKFEVPANASLKPVEMPIPAAAAVVATASAPAGATPASATPASAPVPAAAPATASASAAAVAITAATPPAAAPAATTAATPPAAAPAATASASATVAQAAPADGASPQAIPVPVPAPDPAMTPAPAAEPVKKKPIVPQYGN